MTRGAPDLVRHVRRHAVAVRNGFHPRYAIAYGLSRLFPLFVASTVIAHLYRWAGFRVGEHVAFSGPARVIIGTGSPEHLDIGSYVLIGTDVTLNIDAGITISDGVSIGPHVVIYTASHSIGPGSRRMMPHVVGKPVTIERGAWVGMGTLVLPGVTIGSGSIVGAGSVVSADVPPHSYVEGNPARVVRELPWADR